MSSLMPLSVLQVFLGQKYGYRPIPTHIEAQEFLMLRDCAQNDPEELNLMDTWYRRDDNTVPPVFILQPISSILTNFNNKVSLAVCREGGSRGRLGGRQERERDGHREMIRGRRGEERRRKEKKTDSG